MAPAGENEMPLRKRSKLSQGWQSKARSNATQLLARSVREKGRLVCEIAGRQGGAMVDRASVAIVGVGHTRYGNMPEYDAYDLAVLALNQALPEPGLKFPHVHRLIAN